jgi:short chain dehydrogenase
MKLNGKVAWVVGGSRGIGAAVARELVCRGATVAISARRKEQLHDVAGGDMLVLPADVTDAASVSAAAARVRQELGPIDLAVLSAGYWKQMDPADWDTEVFDQHLRVNLAGMSNSIAAVLPGMLQRHHGVIAGIASVAGYRGLAGAEAYGATKAAQIKPAGVPARPPRPHRRAGHDCLPWLRPHRPHGRQPLPHALHHRCGPGRTENETVIAVDTLTFRPVASGTEVTYAAEFTFKGLSRIVAPLLRPAFERLGNEAEAGLRKALNRL